jgi:hypothetical protein
MGDSMTTINGTHILENALKGCRSANYSKLNASTKSLIDRWKFGAYGWTSPVNLLLTACWYKILNPTSDCCRIWSRDTQNKSIPDSYSIRSADESFTVPFVNRHDIYKSFCSPNSGMQGSRALEKSRPATGRLDRGWSANQRTLFDLDLFSEIMNDIEDGGPDQAEIILQYLLSIAIKFRDDRIAEQDKILKIRYSNKVHLADVPTKFSDPELYRAMSAGLVKAILKKLGNTHELKGTDGQKTSADAQSKLPGDLWVEDLQNDPIIGFEVKDATREIDWTIVRQAGEFLQKFPAMRSFVIITGKKSPIKETIRTDFNNVNALFSAQPYQRNVSVISIYDLINLCYAVGCSDDAPKFIGEYVANMPSIKPETRSIWAELFK